MRELTLRKLTLGIETSCDDTSVALVDDNGTVHGQWMAGQVAGHTPFGGVVPELASRLHSEALMPLIDQAISSVEGGWSRIGLIATTSRPGLIGSLLVGVVTAKTLSLSFDLPLVGVNHIHGHIFSVFLDSQIQFPYVCLVVSGGHTHLYHVKSFTDITLLGQTRDDAAGEAFDKFSNILSLGFPGGPIVDKIAKSGNAKAYAFPRSMIRDENFEFSFSGLKSAALREVEGLPKPIRDSTKSDLAASYQEAICDVLIQKLKWAQKKMGVKNVAIAGGVSANSRLRARAEEWAQSEGLNLAIPPMKYCTDNAAMIAFAGVKRFQQGVKSDQTLTPKSSSLAEDFYEPS